MVADLPRDYTKVLAELKRLITCERLRVVLSANAGMVLLYWNIGRTILTRQGREGWGARVIDRLAADLRRAFPDMHGFFQGCGANGAPVRELCQVLPGLRPTQVQRLLRDLKEDGQVHSRGRTRQGQWFAGPERHSDGES